MIRRALRSLLRRALDALDGRVCRLSREIGGDDA